MSIMVGVKGHSAASALRPADGHRPFAVLAAPALRTLAPSALALLALALAALAFAAPAARAAATFGFNETWQRGGDVALSAGLGATADRIFVAWGDVEPARDQYRWSRLDSLYANMSALRIRPVFVVTSAPAWTRGGDGNPGPPNAAYDDQWREFFRALAQRYPRALGIEVWNEANLARFWAPKSDPVRYVALLRQAYQSVKVVAPGMPVISSGLVGTDSPDAGGMSDVNFLQAIYDAGAKPYMDAIGEHPYPGSGPTTWSLRFKLDRIRRIRNAEGDRGKPIWVTETGISTAGDGLSHPRVTESVQAERLADLRCALYAMTDVPVVLFFRLIDPTTVFGSWEDGLGVYRRDLTPKPAAAAVRAFDAATDCRTWNIRISGTTTHAEIRQPIAFSASGYQGAGPVAYAWDLNGNGEFETRTGAAATVKWRGFSDPGEHRVGVRAADTLEAKTRYITVLVGSNRRPVARIGLTPGRVIVADTTVTLDSRASFDPDKAGQIRRVVWEIRTNDGRIHRFGGRKVTYRFRRPGRVPVRLTVYDNAGGRRAASLSVLVRAKDPGLKVSTPVAGPRSVTLTVKIRKAALGTVSVRAIQRGTRADANVHTVPGARRYEARLPRGGTWRVVVSFRPGFGWAGRTVWQDIVVPGGGVQR